MAKPLTDTEKLQERLKRIEDFLFGKNLILCGVCGGTGRTIRNSYSTVKACDDCVGLGTVLREGTNDH